VGSGEEELDNYVRIVDAAKILGKCTKTVRNYIDHGLLRARRIKGRGRSLWIRRDDLRAVTKLAEEKFRPIDIWDLLKTIKVRLYSIEHKIDFLMHVNGLNVSELRDAKTSVLLAAYDEVTDFLSDVNLSRVPSDQMENWVKVFLQFTEIEYERLVGPTMNMQPWLPFHKLCLGLMNSLRRKKGFSNNPKMQQTYRILDKGRKHIAQAALVFEEVRSSRLGRNAIAGIEVTSSSEDSLDRYIASEAEKTCLH
jgi:hypothetical protein